MLQYQPPNSNTFLTHYLSPVAYNSKKNVEEKFKEALSSNHHNVHYNRRSDLNKEYLDRIEEGRQSDFMAVKYKKNFA